MDKGLPTKVSSIDPLAQSLELCAQSMAPNHLLRQIVREQKPYLDIAKYNRPYPRFVLTASAVELLRTASCVSI